MVISRNQNARRSRNIERDNRFLQGRKSLNNWDKTPKNQNSIQDEIKSRLK